MQTKGKLSIASGCSCPRLSLYSTSSVLLALSFPLFPFYNVTHKSGTVESHSNLICYKDSDLFLTQITFSEALLGQCTECLVYTHKYTRNCSCPSIPAIEKAPLYESIKYEHNCRTLYQSRYYTFLWS